MKQNSLGFTLLEVLIAVAIFAMISLASFSIFDGVLKSEQTSSEQMQRLNEIQRAWMVIERDILQIARRSVRLDGEAPQSAFIHAGLDIYNNSSDALAFVRHGWTNPGLLIPRSDLQAVAYRVEENHFERLHFNFVDSVVGQEPKIRRLITNVSQVEFEYFYQKTWQKKLKGEQIPLAIKLTIETEDFGVLSRKFLVSGDNGSVSENSPTKAPASGSNDNNNNDTNTSNNDQAGKKST